MTVRALAVRLIGCLGVLAISACNTPETASFVSQPRGWDFVQSVGGLSLGQPHRNAEGRMILPIDCDVSGLHSVSAAPSTLNSGLACDTPTVRVEEQRILLTVNTCAATKKYRETHCPPADLGSIPPGQYAVVYRDPQGSEHSLGSLRVP